MYREHYYYPSTVWVISHSTVDSTSFCWKKCQGIEDIGIYPLGSKKIFINLLTRGWDTSLAKLHDWPAGDSGLKGSSENKVHPQHTMNTVPNFTTTHPKFDETFHLNTNGTRGKVVRSPSKGDFILLGTMIIYTKFQSNSANSIQDISVCTKEVDQQCCPLYSFR